jgi:hypothetical protein
MLIHYGNPDPHEMAAGPDGQRALQRVHPHPAVTTQSMRDYGDVDHPACTYRVGTTGAEVRDHLFQNPGWVTSMADNTALLSSIEGFRATCPVPPTWVAVEAQESDPAEAEDFERCLSEFWGCPRGIPADVEATHMTEHHVEGRGLVVFPPGEQP